MFSWSEVPVVTGTIWARPPEGRQPGQFVGGQALVRICIEQGLIDTQPARLLGRRQPQGRDAAPGLLQGRDQGTPLKDPGAVLVALHQPGALQPGHGDPDPGDGLALVCVEAQLGSFEFKKVTSVSSDAYRAL